MPKPGLIKRAAEAGRSPEEQRQFEDVSFQMGYKYCDIDTSNSRKPTTVARERFLAGQELGRRIRANGGQLFTP